MNERNVLVPTGFALLTGLLIGGIAGCSMRHSQAQELVDRSAILAWM